MRKFNPGDLVTLDSSYGMLKAGEFIKIGDSYVTHLLSDGALEECVSIYDHHGSRSAWYDTSKFRALTPQEKEQASAHFENLAKKKAALENLVKQYLTGPDSISHYAARHMLLDIEEGITKYE